MSTIWLDIEEGEPWTGDADAIVRSLSREPWRLLHRLRRIGRRLDDPDVRGECMNLCWLGWMGRWMETLDELPQHVRDAIEAGAEIIDAAHGTRP